MHVFPLDWDVVCQVALRFETYDYMRRMLIGIRVVATDERACRQRFNAYSATARLRIIAQALAGGFATSAPSETT